MSVCLSVSIWIKFLSCSTERKFSLHHGLDTIVHVLDEIFLTAAESAQVRDVKDSIGGVRVLAMTAPDLHIELVRDALEPVPVSRQIGQVDVDRGSQSSAQISGARSDVAHVGVVEELSSRLNSSSST